MATNTKVATPQCKGAVCPVLLTSACPTTQPQGQRSEAARPDGCRHSAMSNCRASQSTPQCPKSQMAAAAAAAAAAATACPACLAVPDGNHVSQSVSQTVSHDIHGLVDCSSHSTRLCNRSMACCHTVLLRGFHAAEKLGRP